MIDHKILDDIAQKIGATLPEGLQLIQRDIEKNVKAVLQNSFSRMDLVTREEFDVQTEVLKRSREKLDKMEKQIEEMDAKLRD